ncbi:MAG: serine protease, partial [Novosphingobium sp.]|nr:serine protease [Novosphingobium sp.]
MKKIIALIIILLSTLLIIKIYKKNINKEILYVPTIKVVNPLEKYSVEIVSINPDLGRCTGVVINKTEEETYILTAKHCISTTEEQYVEDVKPSFVFVSATDDLALIILDEDLKNKSVANIRKEEIKLGEESFLFGYPFWDKTPYSVNGKVIRKSTDWVWSLFQAIPGCSGGGVFDENDELIGILWGIMGDEDVSFFEPNTDILI